MSEAPRKVFSVFVTGASRSGKTTFLESLSEIDIVNTESATKADGSRRKISLDFGRLTITPDKCILHFFASPGRPFGHMDDFFRGELPYIILINPKIEKYYQHFEKDFVHHKDTKRIYQMLSERKSPFLVAASKRSGTDSYSIVELREMLELPKTIPFLECDPVTDPASAKRVLVELFKLLPQDDLVLAATKKLSET